MSTNIGSTKSNPEEVSSFQEKKEKEDSSSYSTKLLEFRTNIKSIREHELHSRFLRASTLKFLAGKNVSSEFFIQAENPSG